jgi:hypothetical protein
MEYILIQHTLGWDFQAYQEISDGNLVRLTDLDGNTLVYPDFPVEGYVVDSNPPKPIWAE